MVTGVQACLLAFALLTIAGAQPSPRRRAPTDDRRRSSPVDDRRRTFDDRRRSFDDRRRALDDRRRYVPPAPPPIICAPHCLDCYTADMCITCTAGYRLNILWGTCDACAPNCRSCDVAGPGKCDQNGCNSRYVFVASEGSCQPCASNCAACRVAGPGACDSGKCDPRYGKNRTGCGPCTSRCRSCSQLGAGSCDKGSCDNRFTNDGALCSPCGASCSACDTSGPHRCDRCDGAFYLSDTKTCIPCGEHCQACTSSGCTACNAWYTLRDGHCSEELMKGGMIGALLAAAVLCCCGGGVAMKKCRRNRDARELQTPLASEMGAGGVRGCPPPSGIWRGYYVYERVNHDVCEFNLDFAADGSVRGNGVDDVGGYTISGKLDRSMKAISFSKKYRIGTRNHLGFVNEDNEGHTVKYSGRLIGDNLGAGFRGTWTIRNSGTNSDGRFHLWPAMSDFQPTAPPPAQVFQVAEDGECVICYERAISTCLQPCGHMAMCQQCVSMLTTPRTCPICRTPIQSVLTQGTGPDGLQALRSR